MKHIPPARQLLSFTCPHCGVISRQYQFSVSDKSLGGNNGYNSEDWLAVSICEHCKNATLWLGQKMIHPTRGSAPLPNEDMPDDVKQDYEEASTIAALSPKSAAALLRLAIQKLCVHLGADGKNINSDIGTLVKLGLPQKVQQSLDIVRVIGNNAVHPGQIDIDDGKVVGHLFDLVNIIVETMISTPKRIGDIYAGLPESTLEAIAKRDAGA